MICIPECPWEEKPPFPACRKLPSLTHTVILPEMGIHSGKHHFAPAFLHNSLYLDEVTQQRPHLPWTEDAQHGVLVSSQDGCLEQGLNPCPQWGDGMRRDVNVLHLHALAFPMQDSSAETHSTCAPVKALRDAAAPCSSPSPPAL